MESNVFFTGENTVTLPGIINAATYIDAGLITIEYRPLLHNAASYGGC